MNFDRVQCRPQGNTIQSLRAQPQTAFFDAEVSKDRDLRLILANLLSEAARRDVPGADTIYDDLKERFPGVAGDPEEEEQEPPPGS